MGTEIPSVQDLGQEDGRSPYRRLSFEPVMGRFPDIERAQLVSEDS